MKKHQKNFDKKHISNEERLVCSFNIDGITISYDMAIHGMSPPHIMKILCQLLVDSMKDKAPKESKK